MSIGSTSSDLISRIRAHDADAWSRMSQLYGPVVYSWARRCGLQADDARDITQEVFRAVVSHIDTFDHQQSHGTFRGWLWTITRNQVRQLFRRRGRSPHSLGGSEAHGMWEQLPTEDDDSVVSNPATKTRLVHRALALIRVEFREPTWQAFVRLVMDEQTVPQVAEALGMSPAAVYQAKSRVLRRLRDQLGGDGGP